MGHEAQAETYGDLARTERDGLMTPAYIERFLSDASRKASRNEIRELLRVIARPDVISLAGGLPSPEAFPLGELAGLVARALERHGAAALQYGTTEGDLGLRRELIRTMVELEGLEAFPDLAPDDLLIVSGSQQGLDVCARTLLSPGDVVVCELPSYLGALGAFGACGARLSGIPIDADGMRTDLLEQRLIDLRQRKLRPKFVYTVPDFHNPAGVSLALERRHELLAIAREFDLLVIEDSPYRPLRYLGDALPSLSSLDRDGRVIALFTLSKVLSPGLRVGWIVAQPEVISRLVVTKQPLDLCTSGLSQLVAREYLAAGALPAQIERVRGLYSARRRALLDGLERHVDPALGVSWTRPEGGLFVWVTLPSWLDAHALLPRALEQKIAFVAGRPFHCDGSGRNTLRLNFSYPTVEQLDLAAERLARCLEGATAELAPAPGAARRETSPPAILASGEHSLELLAWNLALAEVVE
jgi:2-aminoadipate transaminase